MKRISLLLILCLLITLLTGCNNNNAITNVSNNSKSSAENSTEVNSSVIKANINVINNSSACLQYKDKVYFTQGTISDSGFIPQLDRIDVNTNKIEKLFQYVYNNQFYISHEKLYFNGRENNLVDSDIMCLDINTKKAVCLFPMCTMLYFDLDTGTIYFKKSSDNTYSLCSASQDGSNLKTLFSSDKIAIDNAYNAGGSLYFTGSSYSDTQNTPSYIYCLVPNSSTIRLVTSDMPLDGSHRVLQVENLVYAEGWIYYATGDIEGSGAYFYGDIYRIKPDSSNKLLIDSVQSWDFTIEIGYIYYGGEKSKYTEPKNYNQVSKVDGTDKKSFSGVAGSIVYTDKNYIYRYGCDTKNFNFFYRTDLMGNNAKTLITVSQDNKDVAKGIADRLEDVYVVGNWIYYSITNNDESLTKINGVIPLCFKYYRMKLDGTDTQPLLTVNADQ